jgi:hypothetical protein
MVIHEIYVKSLAALEPEDYSPVRVHGDRPKACELALERMKPECCVVEIGYLFGDVQKPGFA